MLSLERPLGVIGGLALFADHADPKRVYYIPTRPQLAYTGAAQELAFVKFRDADAADGGTGLLSFTTELAASDQQLATGERVRRPPGHSRAAARAGAVDSRQGGVRRGLAGGGRLRRETARRGDAGSRRDQPRDLLDAADRRRGGLDRRARAHRRPEPARRALRARSMPACGPPWTCGSAPITAAFTRSSPGASRSASPTRGSACGPRSNRPPRSWSSPARSRSR